MKIAETKTNKSEILPAAIHTILTDSATILILFLKYSILIVLLFLLAGHETANPKIGHTLIEFFSPEFQKKAVAVFNCVKTDTSQNRMEEKLTSDFFKARRYRPAWTLNYETNTSFKSLMEIVNASKEYGLYTSYFDIHELNFYENTMRVSNSDQEKLHARIQLEKTATQTAMILMLHLSVGFGMNDTSKVFSDFKNKLPDYLNYHLQESSLRGGILKLQPKYQPYIKLQKALSNYVKMANFEEEYHDMATLKNNDSLISRNLINHGFLTMKTASDSLSRSLAIRNFQQAHCLEGTGKIDNHTLEALAISPNSKFNTIALNLDRLRKDELQNTNCILVNIPEFKLHYLDDKGEATLFTVVVGKKHTKTPELTSRIERIVANPYWTVPKSITYNEIIPRLRKDSMYLKKQEFSVIDEFENQIDDSNIDWNKVSPEDFDGYWIRQNNSSRNALGEVKFVFPNKYRVFLHDTQSKKLFAKRVRAYSHGCIRVQNPQKLAQIILNSQTNPQKNRINIGTVIKGKSRKKIDLDNPLPIFIRYYTCTADDLGTIYYHTDIYSKDKKAIADMLEKVVRM